MKLHLVWKDPSGFEQVLDQLARIPMRFDSRNYKDIQEGILMGFTDNFESESSGAYGWPPLASRTIEEREDEGFPYPEYPMLVRTGKYKASWTSANHPLHLHRHFVAWNTVFIEEGSKDPRVPALSGGDWVHNVPERPVEELSTEAINVIAVTTSIVIRRAHVAINFRRY